MKFCSARCVSAGGARKPFARLGGLVENAYQFTHGLGEEFFLLLGGDRFSHSRYGDVRQPLVHDPLDLAEDAVPVDPDGRYHEFIAASDASLEVVEHVVRGTGGGWTRVAEVSVDGRGVEGGEAGRVVADWVQFAVCDPVERYSVVDEPQWGVCDRHTDLDAIVEGRDESEDAEFPLGGEGPLPGLVDAGSVAQFHLCDDPGVSLRPRRQAAVDLLDGAVQLVGTWTLAEESDDVFEAVLIRTEQPCSVLSSPCHGGPLGSREDESEALLMCRLQRETIEESRAAEPRQDEVFVRVEACAALQVTMVAREDVVACPRGFRGEVS